MPKQPYLSLTRGVPPTEALSRVAPQLTASFRAVLENDAARTLQYGQQPGYPPLRELIAQDYGVHPDNVMVGNGSLQLQDLLASLLVGRRSGTVLSEQPTYDRALATLKRRGANVIGIPLEADGLSIEFLRAQLKIHKPDFIYLVPDFQNPTGITMSLTKRQEVAQLAERYNFYIIEDIPYRKLRYQGTSVPMLRELNPDKVITVSSYSKLLSPGLRVGYLVGPNALIADLTTLGEATYLSPVLVTQAAVADFIANQHLPAHLDWLKQLYQPRLEATVTAVQRFIPAAQIIAPEGGFFVSIVLPSEANWTDLIGRAHAHELALTPGRPFFADNLGDAHPERFLRLPFCALTPEQITAAVQRLARLI